MEIWPGCEIRKIAGYYVGSAGVILVNGFKGFVKVLNKDFSDVLIALNKLEDLSFLKRKYINRLFFYHLSSYEDNIIKRLNNIDHFQIQEIDMKYVNEPSVIVHKELEHYLNIGDYLAIRKLPY